MSEDNINIKLLKPTDENYPIIMNLVYNAEQYDLLMFDKLIFVPLYQVIDKLTDIKPDIIIKNGEKICPNCGHDMRDENERTTN